MPAKARAGPGVEGPGGVRADKWLVVARVFKTRPLATQACETGRVRINGANAKPHRLLRLGDRVEVDRPAGDRILIVRLLVDRPVPRAEAAHLFEDLSPPPPSRDPWERVKRSPAMTREQGAGRPTKRDRRRLSDALRHEQGAPPEDDS